MLLAIEYCIDWGWMNEAVMDATEPMADYLRH